MREACSTCGRNGLTDAVSMGSRLCSGLLSVVAIVSMLERRDDRRELRQNGADDE